MVKQGILITPVLGEVLTNLAPLRMKHSASVPAYHKGKPTWRSLYLLHVPSHIIRLTYAVQGKEGEWYEEFNNTLLYRE